MNTDNAKSKTIFGNFVVKMLDERTIGEVYEMA